MEYDTAQSTFQVLQAARTKAWVVMTGYLPVGEVKTEKAESRMKGMMTMMTSHQIRHGRQDNHATNHVRCTETRKAGQSRRHVEAKQSETIYQALYQVWSTTPAKQNVGKASRQCLWGKHNR
jgi:hypothetical protein